MSNLGYKIIGDNIDKGVKTRFMRAEDHEISHCTTFMLVQFKIELISVTMPMCSHMDVRTVVNVEH